MPTIETEQGLLIPRETLERLGEWVVEEQPMRIVIRPKSMTDKMRGYLGPLPPGVSETLMEAIESGEIFDTKYIEQNGELAP